MALSYVKTMGLEHKINKAVIFSSGPIRVTRGLEVKSGVDINLNSLSQNPPK